MIDLLLIAAELLLYYGALLVLFRLRHTLGLGLFVTALGALHFLETYLAASLYVALPGGMVISPGSSVLFAGKVMLLLLLYIQEDATAVRQPIYGLLAGNLLTAALVLLLRAHHPLPVEPGREANIGFLNDMGVDRRGGSLLLYLDSIGIVLLYERLGRWLGNHLTARLAVAGALVLTFDQVGFGIALKAQVGVPVSALVGGWVAKVAAAVFYAILTGLYLRHAERGEGRSLIDHKIGDVFGILTYRERYQALLDQTGRDVLTGALTRNRLDTQGRQAVDLALASDRTVSVFSVDLDHMKDINDRFGHLAGDAALQRTAQAIRAHLRDGDYLFRYGGDEFVITAAGLSAEAALALAERLATTIRTAAPEGWDEFGNVSVGVATGPKDGDNFASLFASADKRLHAAQKVDQLKERRTELRAVRG